MAQIFRIFTAVLLMHCIANGGCNLPNGTELTVDITNPDGTPITDNNFTFNTATPGVCDVSATGTSGNQAEDSNLEWSLDSITGSTKTSNPNPAKGTQVTFTYTTLPSSNSQFGKKNLTLKHPQLPDTSVCKDVQVVEIFFDGGDNSKNHPGTGTGITPNWFFYWCHTSARLGTPKYGNQWAGLKWENNQWVYYIGPADNDSYTPPAGGDNGGNTLDGIDNFAWTCRHEYRHVQTSTAWYPNDWDSSLDQDGDWIPDSQESTLGGTQSNPINGGPFDPSLMDTDGDGMRDDEDYTIATQQAWVKGSADKSDWSNPGHQSNK